MVFLEADRVTSTIELADDGNRIFAGTAITGRVVLQVTQPLTARCAILAYKVRYFTIHDLPGGRADAIAEVTRRRHFDDVDDPKSRYTEVLHSAAYVLFGQRSGGDNVPVEPGTYLYPFAIQVPDFVPPTLTGEVIGERHCCCLGCDCRCAKRCTWTGVSHYLKVTVVIANSLVDSVARKFIRVGRAIRPQALEFAVPRMISCSAPAYHCGGCMPSLSGLTSFFRTSHGVVLQLTVLRPVIVADDPALRCVPFLVDGTFSLPLQLCLYRNEVGERTRVLIASLKIAARQNAPLRGALQIPTSARTTLVSSSRWGNGAVSYYVTLAMEDPDACCGALLERDVPKIPVTVFDSVSHRAPFHPEFPDYQNTGPLLARQPSSAPMGDSEPFAIMTPQVGPAAVVPGAVVGTVVVNDAPLFHHSQPYPIQATYAYQPPPAYASQAHLVGSVTESLPAAVWGTVVP